MDVGKLNHQVKIQKPIDDIDAYGQTVQGWLDVATVWANIKPIGVREKLRAMAVEASISHTVMIRYRSDFLPLTNTDSWRIFLIDRVLQIQSASNVSEEKKYILFECIETGVL